LWIEDRGSKIEDSRLWIARRNLHHQSPAIPTGLCLTAQGWPEARRPTLGECPQYISNPIGIVSGDDRGDLDVAPFRHIINQISPATVEVIDVSPKSRRSKTSAVYRKEAGHPT
jgi:hypothetical protein